MTEIDTAAEREAANELIESGEATGQDFADVVPELLDAYDRLQSLLVRDADGTVVSQSAYNALRNQNARLKAATEHLKQELAMRPQR